MEWIGNGKNDVNGRFYGIYMAALFWIRNSNGLVVRKALFGIGSPCYLFVCKTTLSFNRLIDLASHLRRRIWMDEKIFAPRNPEQVTHQKVCSRFRLGNMN